MEDHQLALQDHVELVGHDAHAGLRASVFDAFAVGGVEGDR